MIVYASKVAETCQSLYTGMNKTSLFVDGHCLENHQPEINKRKMIFVVTDEGGEVLADSTHPGGSNNLAPLLGVLLAMQWANQNGHRAVTIKTHSRTIAAWIFGRIGSGINDRHSVLHARQAITALRRHIQFEADDLIWVPREQNPAANVIQALYDSCVPEIMPRTDPWLIATKAKSPRRAPWAKTMVI